VQWAKAAPRIVAEELLAVADPLVTALRPGGPAAGKAVASSLALSLAPEEDASPAPAWLHLQQQQSFRRVAAAVRRYRGAMLADPVGSGKTFVALGVAALFNNGNPTACFVPATIIRQWEAVAARLGVPVLLCSHEQVSRGKLPLAGRGLVIIDECHHYRNNCTRRYAHLAPWLVGRRTLLVTATPIVNRPIDLAHQLLLAVRDDVLAWHGVPSLKALLGGGRSHPALGQLVFEGESAGELRPRPVATVSPPSRNESTGINDLVTALDQLRLSRDPSVARLIRIVLLRSVASSPAAVAGTLRRYRQLLLHARDARNVGQSLDRAQLRRFSAELGDQLMWWELLPASDSGSDLELSDIPTVEAILQQIEAAGSEADLKLERLRQILRDKRRSLVFVCSRDTVRYLRNALEDRVAWCTGERAGIGHTRLRRETVMDWFRPGKHEGTTPLHLVVTDVAAEGLDLQSAARVIHYDLPWNPMRLEQRAGRAVRLGSLHAQVEVVRFAPLPILERALRLEATLAQKARLPASAGLGPEGRRVWRWMGELAQRFGAIRAVAGLAALPAGSPGLLAGFTLHHSHDSGTRISSSIGWQTADGSWSEDPKLLELLLARAAEQEEVGSADGQKLRGYLALLARTIRARLRATESRKWSMTEPAPAARLIADRLQHLIRAAARSRDAARLLRLEGALRVVAGGHTAGEATLIGRMAEEPDTRVVSELSTWPANRVLWEGIEVRLSGMVLFS
jgi:superfamily II DNA or RNA helicase